MGKVFWQNPCDHDEEEITNKLSRLVETGQFYVQKGDGKLVRRDNGLAFAPPWIHFRTGTARHCAIWNQVYCQLFKLIPKECRHGCWKTVIKPRTVVELFELCNLMDYLDLPSKCGIDRRDYTPGPYAAFIYGDSMAEGREYYNIIKKHVAEHISPDVPILLKRACTEMEQMLPSDQWDPMSDADKYLQKKLDDVFVFDSHYQTQAEWNRNMIKRMWLRHAMSIGDETWRDIAGEVEGFHPHVVHYQTDEAFEATKTIPEGIERIESV